MERACLALKFQIVRKDQRQDFGRPAFPLLLTFGAMLRRGRNILYTNQATFEAIERAQCRAGFFLSSTTNGLQSDRKVTPKSHLARKSRETLILCHCDTIGQHHPHVPAAISMYRWSCRNKVVGGYSRTRESIAFFLQTRSSGHVESEQGSVTPHC